MFASMTSDAIVSATDVTRRYGEGDAAVDELRAGKEVHSTRGPALCTFKQAERILAGFEDPRPGAVAGGGAAGHASVAGLLVSQGRTPTGPVATTEASE